MCVYFGPGLLSNKPSVKLTICPQPGATWNYDYSSDPFVPALAQLGETVKYYYYCIQNNIWL